MIFGQAKIIGFLLSVRSSLLSFWKGLFSFLRNMSWRGWLILLLLLLILFGSWFFWQSSIKAAERERELLRDLARAQGQVELGEGVIYANAERIEGLYRRLAELHGANSTLQEKINRRIEDPIVSVQTEIRYRDRIVYVYSPENPTNPGTASTTIEEVLNETGEIVENAIVEFDLERTPFRIFGRTESVGPRIQIELEQVEPFILSVVVTRERRNGEWNLFIEDQSETLDININHFLVDDRSLTQTRFLDRLGVGGNLSIQPQNLNLGVHGSLDVGRRSTVWAGPELQFPVTNEERLQPSLGIGLGFTARPFVRARNR